MPEPVRPYWERSGPPPRPGQPALLRGATVLSMDPVVGDLPSGDLLIEGGLIAAVGPDLAERAGPDAAVVDLAGAILVPGLVDGHRHCWQNAFRRLIPDADMAAYMATTHGGMALHYRPEDMYAGTLATLAGALDGGVTTVLDLSHNSRTAAHSDAVLRAYADAGIRAVHAAAPPNAGDWDEQLPEDLLRLRSAAPELVTVRLAVDFRRVRPAPELFGWARDHGFAITVDAMMGPGPSAEVADWGRAGLLGPDLTVVHGTDLGPQAWRALAAAGTAVTLAPTSDQQLGLADGVPPIQRALEHGIEPALSVDVEISLASDLYAQMRAVLATQRMHATYEAYHGRGPRAGLISTRDVLRYATVCGAGAVGLGAVCGRLAPGLAADVVVITAEDVNNLPLNDAYGTVVLGTDGRNVDTVLVGGRPRKWRGELVGLDVGRLRGLVHTSRDRLAAAGGWTLDVTRGGGTTESRYAEVAGYLDDRQHAEPPRPGTGRAGLS